MPIVVTAGSSGAKSEPVPAGTHHAVCYGIVDLGTQVSEKFGPKRKLALLWEVPEERITVQGKDLPRGISKRYTATLNEKGTLRKDLEGWRGRPFTTQELAGFEMSAIVGKNCLVNIVHKDSTRGTHAEVAGVVALPKGMPVRKAENNLVNFSVLDAITEAKKLGHRDVQWPEGIPQWLCDVCSKAVEYVEFATGAAVPPAQLEPQYKAPEISEEVPF
jgi:hypothetical protein